MTGQRAPDRGDGWWSAVVSLVVDPRQIAQDELVRTLIATDVFGPATNQNLFRELLIDQLGTVNLRHHGTPRYDCVEVVQVCRKISGGLATLASVLDRLGETAAASAAQLCADEIDALDALDGEITPKDWAKLREALDSRALPDAPALARAVTRDRLPSLPPHCRSMWRTFLVLVPINADSSGVLPWLTFLGVVAERLDAAAADTVRRWAARVAANLDLGEDVWGATRWATRFLDQATNGRQSGYLVIRLEPVVADAEQIVVSSWRQWQVGGWRPVRSDDLEVPATEVPRTVERLVEDMESEWGVSEGGQHDRASELTLEFVLPDELLNLPIESWQCHSDSTDPDELGLQYPVVVRSLRRLRTRKWHRPWHVRWQCLATSGGNGTTATAHRSSSRRDGDLHTLRAALRPEHVVCLVLSEPPGKTGGTGTREVELALQEGFPVLLWHRGDCSTPTFLEAVDALLADGDYSSLPRRVMNLRREAHKAQITWKDGPSGASLALLWDDPLRTLDAPAG